MSGFELHNGQWWCDQVAVEALADEYGTPLYVYSRARIEENYHRVQYAFKALNAHIHFSVKSNANGAILRVLRALGSGFDVVSAGEAYRALRAGALPASIVFAGVGKTEKELIFALENNLGWINVESVQELELLNRLADERHAKPQVALRVNPVVEADTHHHLATGGHRSKFGIDVNDVRSILLQASQYLNLDLAGLHFHIGSQLANTAETVDALHRVLELATLHPIRNLDIGGGFPVPYRPSDELPDPSVFAEAVQQVLKSNARRSFEITIEPGRSIIADAGALIATVQYTKVREGRRIVVCDASMTELIRPVLYDAYHHIVPVKDGQPSSMVADIVGPVCETGDTLGYDRELAEVARGDRLQIMNAGAYGMTMASNYNSRPRPAEVLVDGKFHRLIRRRETWDDLVTLEE
ncbi:MAG TPA: diaminopimelate decarboxylase [Anaerolineae bacterium]|nr:diaminopimelate decarboxylase [Anaerolineae bacterium]